MKSFPIVIVCLLAASASSTARTFKKPLPKCVKNITLEAHIGGSVNISCENKRRHEIYLCKDGQPECTEQNTGSTKKNYVIKSSLKQEDEGEYWCAYREKGEGKYKCSKKVHLKVSISGVVVGVVGSVILLIAVVLLYVYRHKLPRIQGSSDWITNSGDKTEEVQGNHHEELQGKTTQAGNAVSSVNATVNPPPDQIHYATVNFQNDSAVVSTVSKAHSKPEQNISTEYSSVHKNAHPPAPDTTLYSTVIKLGEP